MSNLLKIDLKHIVDLEDETTFNKVAWEVYSHQAIHNPVYYSYHDYLSRGIAKKWAEIPFLPISAFKHHDVQTGIWNTEAIYTSSGTTGESSRHLVKDRAAYLLNTVNGFKEMYGPPGDYCFLGLLPSYLEREGSSLIDMVDHFISLSSFSNSGFYLHNHYDLYNKLEINRKEEIPTILIGVSYALWDFVEQYQVSFPDLIVMETGGMKGRKEEIPRYLLHEILTKGFGVNYIHSEYGMTEMMSQAYSKKEGIFKPTSTMRIVVTQINDAFKRERFGKTGVINIIDLANQDTCSFIQTEDIGIVYEDGSFEIAGRLDQSDVRGCNLMVSDL